MNEGVLENTIIRTESRLTRLEFLVFLTMAIALANLNVNGISMINLFISLVFK